LIKRIKNSLTINICILIAVLLIASSGITYAVIVGFLPTYYSKQLQKDIDSVSQEMIETIHSYETLNEASYAIELFEAGSKVSVVILDEQGNRIWPAESTAATEDVLDNGVVEQVYMGDMILTHENSAEQTTIVQEENAAYEEGVIGQADVVTEDVVQQADGIAEAGDNSAVKRYSVTVGGETYTMIVSGGMQPVNQALEILYQILPYILGIAIVVSILFALGASLYLTFPIVRLSQLAQNMAALDFDSSYQGKRTDEVGVLGESLNELSKNLSRALEELRSANEKLKSDIEMERKIEKKRIAFFSAVSHELKTPITILKGHLSGMLQGVGEYRDRNYYLQRSLETTEKMEDMVKELLTVSRIENNKFITQKTDIAEQLRLQIADMAELIENKKLELQVEIPEHLYADVNPVMMDKVFSNLLLNAIRYTPEEKGNHIRVLLKPGTDTGTVYCQIENTGVFIPEEALVHLFEAFYRVEQSRNRQTGGSGLGLYIVKMILDQHGASYRMGNTCDGVRFSFSL
jgi:signal transduction histidine kinase